MATIITKNSTGSGVTPSSLVQGELAINVVDGRLFYGSGSGNAVREFTPTSTPTFPYTGSATITGSLIVTGSTISTLGFTGSLQGTASWAISASTVISSSYAVSAGNSSTIDINVFSAPVDSYLLISNVAGTTGVAIGSDADLRYNTSTNILTVGNISAITLTGSLQGTSSNAVSASTSSLALRVSASSINSDDNNLYDSLGAYSISWENRRLVDSAGNTSIMYGDRYLIANDGATAVLDYSHVDGVIINGKLDASNITGSLYGTSSWATNASTASFLLGSVTSASYAATASLLLGSVTSASFASTASSVNTLNQNVIIANSLTVGTSSLGSGENTLTVGLPSNGGTGEGGQILLMASGGLYSSASMLDNYQNKFRVLRGTNAGSDAFKMQIDLHTGQVQIPNYTGSGAFPGTAAATLAVDSSGNVITTTGGGSSISYQTIVGSATGLAAATTRYGNIAGSTSEGQQRVPVPVACTMSNLYVRTAATMPTNSSLQVTLFKNGSGTSVTLTIAAGSVAGTYSDTINTATFAAGDGFNIQFTNAGSATAAASSGQGYKITI